MPRVGMSVFMVMNKYVQPKNEDKDNPFAEMGFVKFWLVSTVFWFSFPLSLGISYLALGQARTKQLIKALVHDFIQTLFLIIVAMCAIFFAIYYFFSNLL